MRESERSPTSLNDLRRSGGRNSSGQEQKFIYLTKARRGYQKHGISPRIKARSLENQRFRVKEVSTRLPRVSSMLQEVGILPTLVYFPL